MSLRVSALWILLWGSLVNAEPSLIQPSFLGEKTFDLGPITSIPKPNGVQPGDLLIAFIVTDGRGSALDLNLGTGTDSWSPLQVYNTGSDVIYIL
jgi:hypothetical protein